MKVASYLILLTFLFLLTDKTYSQVRIFERNTNDTIANKGLFLESSQRTFVNLNGQWELSFNEGHNFAKVIVPLAYNFSGVTVFKKRFVVSDELVSKYSFILVAEGINYESEISINGVFVTKHTGGSSSIVNLIEENIISKDNTIEIKVNNCLSYSNTIPLSNQVNYSKNYGGINRDIYLIAVPKIFVSDCQLLTSFESASNMKLTNKINIKTTELTKVYSGNEFRVRTYVILENITDSSNTIDTVSKSDEIKFNLENFKSQTFENNLTISNPLYWSPQNPNLYKIRTIITDADGNLVDEFNMNYGFRDVKFTSNAVVVNGTEMVLKGINYYEDSYKYASALSYSEVETDIKNIKALGCNAIRVPGRSAHPYIISLANKYGLFVMMEIPFNEVPYEIMKDDDYRFMASGYIEDVINVNRNNPSILMWGIGNDFDVTQDISSNYVKEFKEYVNKLDSRKVYFTTRNLSDIKNINESDIVCLNLEHYSFEYIKKFVDDVNNISLAKKFQNKTVFISGYGRRIDNNNRNGYSDIHSVEYQTKFLMDVYSLVKTKFPGSIISSYADWTADRPLNFPLDHDPFINTTGLYTIKREPKQAQQYVQRMLNNQESPKILEGNSPESSSNVFIIVGIVFNIIFLVLITNLKRLKETFWKGLYRPKNFFLFASEQFLIPNFLNVVLAIFISVGIALFWASVFNLYRESNDLDMLLANIFASDTLKIWFSTISNSPQLSIPVLTVINFILILFTAVIIFVISLFTRRGANFKNVYTVAVWSSLPFIIFLPVGTIIYKLGLLNSEYIYLSIILFALIHLVYLYRLINGARIVLEFSILKSFSYAVIIILILYGGFISYFYYGRNTFYLINLISSYN